MGWLDILLRGKEFPEVCFGLLSAEKEEARAGESDRYHVAVTNASVRKRRLYLAWKVLLEDKTVCGFSKEIEVGPKSSEEFLIDYNWDGRLLFDCEPVSTPAMKAKPKAGKLYRVECVLTENGNQVDRIHVFQKVANRLTKKAGRR